MDINIIDIVVLFVAGYALVAGYKKGFISILFDALAIGTSFFLASKYHLFVDDFFRQQLNLRGAWVTFLTLILTYLISFIIFKLIGKFLTKIFLNTSIGTLNKLSGMGLNVIKWLLIVIVVMLVLIRIPAKDFQKYIKQSYLYLSYDELVEVPGIKALLPKHFTKK